MNFKAKNVLITGAAHGIGAAFAKYFAGQQSNVWLVDIDETALNKRKAEISQSVGTVTTLVKDVGDESERLEIFNQFKEKNLELDVLVNNVGIGYWSNLSETPWERIEKVINVNVLGTTHLVWLFLPSMVKRNSGAIINVASTGAFCGANKAAAYTGSKAYVMNFTEALDMELFGSNVKTLTAFPGATDTNFWEANGTANSKFYERIKKMSPEETVSEFIEALKQGKSTIIAGRQNRAMVMASKFVPRPILKKMAVKKYM